jgi:hypothetical protein
MKVVSWFYVEIRYFFTQYTDAAPGGKARLAGFAGVRGKRIAKVKALLRHGTHHCIVRDRPAVIMC